MRNTRAMCLAVVFALSAVGCGDGDLNKDLKPVDKNAPRPTAAGAGAGSGGSIKAPSTPP